jgi:hypothetical protein
LVEETKGKIQVNSNSKGSIFVPIQELKIEIGLCNETQTAFFPKPITDSKQRHDQEYEIVSMKAKVASE